MSTLTAQLRAARQAVGVKAPVVRRGKASILFSPQKAAELDVHAIYQLGLRGFQELCRRDARFEPFGNTLFGQAAVELDRDAKTPEANRKLDASVASFLGLLSDHLMLPAAMQALEFLIRRLNVHERNQDALMGAALVYHETHQFVRLVQIMPLQGTMWHFLTPMQKSGAPLPRATLVRRCLNDQAVLRFVAENASTAVATGASTQLQVAFFAVLTAEVLQASPRQVDEGTAALLLPHVRAGLAKSGGLDMRAAAHIVLAQLAVKATLSAALLSELLGDIIKNAQPAETQETLLLVAQLFATQPHLTTFPSKALKHLVKLPHLAAELTAATGGSTPLAPLLTALLPSLAAAHLAISVHAPAGTYEELVVSLVEGMPLPLAAVEAATAAVLQTALGEEDDSSLRSASLGRMLRALNKKDSSAVDAAVSAALTDGAAAAAAGVDAGPRRQRLLPLLRVGLAGGASAPLPDNSSTLRLAVDAASAATRIMALRDLDRAAQEDERGPLSADQRAFLAQAMLRRLADDSADVVAVTLGLSSLRLVPPAALFDALAAVVSRASQAGSKLSIDDIKGLRGNARKAVKLLAGEFVERHPSYSERVGVLLLGLLLPLGPIAKGGKLPIAALKGIARINHPLLEGLKAIQGEVRETALGAQGQPAAVETVVAALAQRLMDSPSARRTLVPVLQEARPAASLLIYMAILQACQAGPVPALASAAMSALLATRPEYTDAAHEQAKEVEASGAMSTVYAAAERDLTTITPPVHLAALLAVIEGLPPFPPNKLQEAYRAFHELADCRPIFLYDELLAALLRKVAETQPVPVFLAQIFGAGRATSPALQERSLQHLREYMPWIDQQLPASAEAFVRILPHLLAALSSWTLAVRAAALAAVDAVAAATAPAAAATDGTDSSAADGSMSRQHLLALLTAVASARDAVVADPEAVVQLLADTLAAAPEEDADGMMSDSGSQQQAKTPARRGRPRKAAPAVAEHAAVGPLQLAGAAAAATAAALAGMLGGLTGPADAAAARVTLRVLAAWRSPAARLQAALPLLRALSPSTRGAAGAHAAASAPAALSCSVAAQPAGHQQSEAAAAAVHEQITQLSVEALALYCPEAVQMLAMADESVMEPLAAAGWQLKGGRRAEPAERIAARRLSTRQLHDALPASVQRHMFTGIVWGAFADPDGAAREAARAALRQLPIRLEYVQPLLQGLAGSAEASVPLTARKRSRGKKASASVSTAQAPQPLPGVSSLDAAMVALELLGWADVENGDDTLVPLLCACLRALATAAAAPPTAPAADAAAADSTAATTASDDASDDELDTDDRAAKPGQAGYAMQLCLAALLRIAQPAAAAAGDQEIADADADAAAGGSGASADGWDAAAVVEAARAAPDGATRNQALALLAVLARSHPQAALQHVMDVVAVAGGAAAAYEDAHSTEVATDALLSVLPAWLAAGRPAAEAVAAVVDAALGLPPHRRLPLLAALLAALPEEEALPLVLQELLRRAAQDEQAAVHVAKLAASAAVGALPPSDSEAAAQPLALAASLSSQASELQRARAYLALLHAAAAAPSDAAMDDSSSSGGAIPQLQLATLFVASRLQTDASASGSTDEHRGGASEELQGAYAALLLQALLQQQGLGAEQGPSGRKAAASAAAALLAVLQSAMAPASYAAALVLLSVDPANTGRVRRRALVLLATAAERTGQQLLAAEPQRRPAFLAASDAALAFCAHLSAFFAPVRQGEEAVASPATRQAALVTFGALAQHLGRAAPGPVAGAAPAVLAAFDDPHRAVRSSALAAAAALVAGLGTAAVPLLPRLAPRALAAARAALEAVGAAETAGRQAADTPVADVAGTPGSAGKRGKKLPMGRAEAAALEAAAALAVAAALVRSLPKFLSPYLPALLEHTLNPLVWGPACSAVGAAGTAAAIRLLLPTTVPARLLLPALAGHLPHALRTAARPTAELLDMAASMLAQLKPGAALGHAEAAFRFLLPALDVRQTRLEAFGPEGVAEVERHAVMALQALTVKLSERAFKPLFLRFVEWARATLPPGPDGTVPPAGGRPAVLFAAAAALTNRLGSIFVPYFRYLLDPAVAALEPGGGGEVTKKPPKKKRRKSADAEPAAAAAPAPPSEAAIAASWRLRTQVLLALEQLFTHDGGGFLDEARFQRLLQPLVAQLHGAPPPELQPSLAALLPPALATPPADASAAGEKADATALDAAGDPFGAAAAAALTRMAAAAGSDTMYRPLNRAVLMATRGGEPRTRRRALAVVAGLVAALREEYGLLLPEALPFLSELLEDEDAGVAAAAAALVSRLEELTGEPFDQYLKA